MKSFSLLLCLVFYILPYFLVPPYFCKKNPLDLLTSSIGIVNMMCKIRFFFALPCVLYLTFFLVPPYFCKKYPLDQIFLPFFLSIQVGDVCEW